MVDIIRHRPIHRLREHHQAIQLRSISAYSCPVKTVLVVCLFTMNDGITNTHSVR